MADSRRLLLLLLPLLMGLSGCSGYVVRGKVIKGDFSSMSFVEADDRRLAEPGLPGTQILVYRDPDKPGRTLVGRGQTDADGNISVPLDAFGAGYLVEKWRIEARRGGYEPAILHVPLPSPSSGRRLLIILAPGYATPEQESLMDQFQRFR